MNDAGAIALKFGAISVTRLGKLPALRFAGLLGKGREQTTFVCFHFLARFIFVQSRSSFSPKIFRAARSCARSISKSKRARRSAVRVNQAQATQKKTNQPGCSRAESNG